MAFTELDPGSDEYYRRCNPERSTAYVLPRAQKTNYCELCRMTLPRGNWGVCLDAGACIYRYYIRVRGGYHQSETSLKRSAWTVDLWYVSKDLYDL